ncbi:hypothetical protein GCM10009682_60580 [Luedemannella flava]|uniref:Uncharacterized protein n=1 Tax=Luedemannella flava TaxID=349316 RepID=A0ABP4YXS9_9ACTN
MRWVGPADEECVVADDGTVPLRQGDVFAFLPEYVASHDVPALGIVVTADCDLARNKHHGIVSYVPVYSIADYTADFVLPKIAEQFRDKRLQGLTALVNQLDPRRGTNRRPLMASAVEEWVRSGETAEIIEYLRLEAPKERAAVETAAQELRNGLRALDAEGYVAQFEALTHLYSRGAKKSPAQQLRDEINGRLTGKLPGDAFFISSFGPAYTAGYIAYLRLVREARSAQIAISYHQTLSHAIVARRVAHLLPPYVYRLTQQLADVFAAIGLPTAYEERRARLVRDLLDDTGTE